VKYRSGESISIFGTHASCVRVDGPLATQMAKNMGGPKPGDFVVIRGGYWLDDKGKRTRDSAHIFVLLEVVKADGKEVKWRVGQCGVNNNAGEQCGQIMTLTGTLKQDSVKEGDADVKGPNLVFIANIRGEEPNFPRRVTSYTNVEAIAYGAQPSG